MRRSIGYVALGLGSIGLVGCLVALVVLWVVRPAVLRLGTEVFDAAADGLKLVEEKTGRAGALVKKIRGSVDTLDQKLVHLAEKPLRSPEVDKELTSIKEEVAERMGQVGAMVEAAETALAVLSKTSRLTRTARPPASGSAPWENARDISETLLRFANKYRDLRENLAKIREDKYVRKEIVANIIRVARDVIDDLKAIDAKVVEVGHKAVALQTEMAELGATVSAWTNGVAILGSVLLAWLGLGQFALARWGWKRKGAFGV